MKLAIGLGLGALAFGMLAVKRAGEGGHSRTELGAIPFVPALAFTPANRQDVRVIVVHTTEAPKTTHTARDVANWTHTDANAKVSAHYVIDADNVVATVREQDIAWHARTANPFSIGLEHAGTAAQNAAQWDDEFNRRMLARSAELAARIARRWSIPAVWLSAAELKKPGARGITGHRECTDAFEGGQGHGDPGAAFPRAHYVDLVRAAMEGVA